MNIATVKTLFDIREFTLWFNGKVEFIDYYGFYEIYHYGQDKTWLLHTSIDFIISEYFTNKNEFVAWLNNDIQNIKFEFMLAKYLKLKCFI